MERSIIVKAETIEEAVRLGISILNVDKINIEVEVLSNPGRSLFGFRKSEAEVRVTTIEKENIKQSIKTKVLDGIVDDLIGKTDVDLTTSERFVKMNGDKLKTGARILNGKVDVLFSGKSYPIIEPQSNVRLFVNNEKVEKRVIIKPQDEIIVKVSDELIPPFFSIRLIEQDMIAMIEVIPGKIITRTLLDTNYEKVLMVIGEEYVEYYNDIKPQAIVEELKLLGIQKGLLFPAIKQATEVLVNTQEVIARGVQPTTGIDGDIVVHIGLVDERIDELAPVDFREKNTLLTISAGEIIATYIPANLGIDGVSLLGKVISAKKINEIIIRLGNHVEMIDRDIVAKIAGKPSIERRNRYVKIDVLKEFVHSGEVDLKSGNIRFEGDVRIGGNVHPSMYVSAYGTVHISGSVTKAIIHSTKAVTVGKNVFTSTISVGKQKYILGELATNLEVIVEYLEQLRDAVKQILLVRGAIEERLSPAELNHLIRLLLEKRYSEFQEMNKDFIQKVKNHSMVLTEEWVELANRFYNVFIHTASEELKDEVGLELLIDESWVLIELYSTEPEPKSTLSIPYAINSELYCNGNIHITSKGLYHSFVTAGNHITVNGVCRGGEVFAENEVILHESGSRNNVRTIVRTGETGIIRIGFAYAGTEVVVGSKKCHFEVDYSNVYIKLDENGNLFIG